MIILLKFYSSTLKKAFAIIIYYIKAHLPLHINTHSFCVKKQITIALTQYDQGHSKQLIQCLCPTLKQQKANEKY